MTSDWWIDLKHSVLAAVVRGEHFDVMQSVIDRDSAKQLSRETHTRCAYWPASGCYTFFQRARIGRALLDNEIA